jgi:hypothetical protein
VVGAESLRPWRRESTQVIDRDEPRFELATMALSVVEGDRFHAAETFESPRQACGRVLSTGEKDEGAVLHRA